MSERAIVKRLIDSAAHSRLGPLGLRQKGHSRLWYDDRGWFLIVVGFDPGTGVGTYLNVAAHWLWYDLGGREVWFYDDGGRVHWRADGTFTTDPALGSTGWSQHLGYIREHIFAREMDLVADVAARRVLQLREEFPDPCTAARRLSGRPTRLGEDPTWHGLHTGTAHALCGDAMAARHVLGQIGPRSRSDAYQRASDLLAIGDPDALRQAVIGTIHARRTDLGLPPWTQPVGWP